MARWLAVRLPGPQHWVMYDRADELLALAAADPPRTMTAIPTTLSGAEMTGGHRHAGGVPADTPKVRPALVVNDPRLSASAPVAALAASSANAMGHAVTAFVASGEPATRARAFEATVLIARAWSPSGSHPDRPSLALGALLAGWALGDSGLGLHHVIAQTLVRTAGLGHAQANALVLPASIGALRRRHPAEVSALEALAGTDLTSVAVDLRERAGASADPSWSAGPGLHRAVDAVLARPELRRRVPSPTRAEVEHMLRAAVGKIAPDAQ